MAALPAPTQLSVYQIFVVVLVIAINGHSKQADQRSDIDTVVVLLLAAVVTAGRHAARERSTQYDWKPEASNIHVRFLLLSTEPMTLAASSP